MGSSNGLWWHMIQAKMNSVAGLFQGFMAANYHIGDLENSLSRAQITQPSLVIGRQQTPITKLSWLPVRVHLASWRVKIPTEHCPLLWLDKGSGVIGWLIAPCRLWFFSLIAGWVVNVWCWHALKMFCPSLNVVFACACCPFTKKTCIFTIMALGRRRLDWLGSCTEDPKLSDQYVLRARLAVVWTLAL